MEFTSTVYLLYYHAPYEEGPELICACSNRVVVSNIMYLYMRKHPDAYPDRKRFEIKPIEFWDIM